VPHLLQNFSPAVTGSPHFGQNFFEGWISGAPHFLQNLPFAGFGAEHFGQLIPTAAGTGWDGLAEVDGISGAIGLVANANKT